MVNTCCVKDCSKCQVRDTDIRFFRFAQLITHQGEEIKQKSEDRVREWLENLQLKNLSAENSKHRQICSLHFVSRECRPCKPIFYLQVKDVCRPDFVFNR